MLRHLIRPTLVTAAALALIPTAAQAKAGDKTFAQTYPYASALCARTAAGNPPKKLAGETGAVMSACNALQGSFTNAHNAVVSAQTTYTTGVANAQAQLAAACAPPRNKLVCQQARIVKRETVRTLRAQHRAAVRTYYIDVEGARRMFWSTIRALRGGASITPDRPIAVQGS